MRPVLFPSSALRQKLLRSKIATLPELKNALGTSVALTVFRKLKPMDYLTSYSHAGRYYTLREIAQFDPQGLWSHKSVWFSERGSLLATAADFVQRSPKGYFADELTECLHVQVHDALLQLVQQGRIARQRVSGAYLYTAEEAAVRQRQLRARGELRVFSGTADARAQHIAADELHAAILLFYSMLDEKTRRLYAGLEALKLGHGGDRHLADLLGLDAHTVARGRHELLSRQLATDRVRRSGGGQHASEKKPRNNLRHRNGAQSRHRRRPHERTEMDAQEPREDCSIASATRHWGVCQHRREATTQHELQPSRKPQVSRQLGSRT